MARRLLPSERLAIPASEVCRSIGADNPDTADQRTEAHVITTLRGLDRFWRSLQVATALLRINEPIASFPETLKFEAGNPIYAEPGCVGCYTGEFKINETTLHCVIVMYGSAALYQSVGSILKKVPLIVLQLETGTQNPNIHNPQPGGELTGISKDSIIVFRSDEQGLYQILVNPAIPLPSKVASAWVTLFPHTIPALTSDMTLVDYSSSTPGAAGSTFSIQERQQHEENGFNLGILALFTLGPAYSQADRVQDQVLRRIKAIAASTGTNSPTASVMSAIVGISGWQVTDLPPPLYTIIGAGIAIDKEGNYNPGASIPQLMELEKIRQTYNIGAIPLAILEQARLVYTNFHSTSIHFVPMVVGALRELVGDRSGLYGGDFANYAGVEEIIQNAPYLGVRPNLPESLQIKSFPRLVYTALLYYKRSLTEPSERQNFELYKIAEIKNHIPDKTQITEIENIVHILPDPTTNALVALVRQLPLDKASSLMNRCAESQRAEVLDRLRRDPNPGQWAQNKISKENKEVLARLTSEARSKAHSMATAQYDQLQGVITTVEDPDQKRILRTKLEVWRQQVFTGIEDLAPLDTWLSEVDAIGQERIRDEVLRGLRQIVSYINANPFQ